MITIDAEKKSSIPHKTDNNSYVRLFIGLEPFQSQGS